MDAPVAIPLPLTHVGSVNAWLLRGDPITLIDTGPRDDGALTALEAGLGRYGLRVEDIELLLATHHHLDHVGLAATIQRRSGATVAVLDRTADYAARYSAEVEEDRLFAHALMRHHGVAEPLIADTEELWDYIRATTESFRADVRLADGDRIQAGGRSLRVVARPGHSTTDTLFVEDRDAIAFAGDHLLARISSNTEICPPDRARDGRARSRLRYLANLELTADMPLARLLTGHGAPVIEHRRLVEARLRDHRRRCERILGILDGGPRTAFEIAGGLWPGRTLMRVRVVRRVDTEGTMDTAQRGISRRGFRGAGVVAGVALASGRLAAPSGAAAARTGSWIEASIPELQVLMASRQLTSRKLTVGYLRRIASLNPLLGAVIETNPSAVSIAARLDRERRAGRVRGPLHGIPVLLKDNIATDDRMHMTAGSLALVHSRVPADAPIVSRLRRAGAVILGKANLSEWANFRGFAPFNGWSARGGFTRDP